MQRLKQALRRMLPKSQFARGVGVLVGGTAGAQLLTVLAAQHPREKLWQKQTLAFIQKAQAATVFIVPQKA